MTVSLSKKDFLIHNLHNLTFKAKVSLIINIIKLYLYALFSEIQPDMKRFCAPKNLSD